MPPIDFKHIAVLIAYAVITATLNLIFSKRSQIDEWCEANPKLAALAKLCRGFGIDPWAIFQSVVLAFTKKLPDYQKQSLEELKSKPKDPPPPSFPPLAAAGFWLLVCFSVLHLTACAPTKPPCDQAKLAAIVAVCTAQSQQCVSEGKSEAECSSLNECDDEIDRACGVTK